MIGVGGITRLAEMICGDAPFDFFPYRSSLSLTRFFVDLDMEYVHDGSTRRHWVNDVLTELNGKQPAVTGLPSKEIIKVIESLLHPDSFLSNTRRCVLPIGVHAEFGKCVSLVNLGVVIIVTYRE